MVDIKADNPRAFSFGELTDLRDSYTGGLELTSKNLFPDPRFLEFEGDGDLSYWGEFLLPPIKRGRNVYFRKKGGKVTRQNEDRIGLHRHSFLQDDPLVNGPELPGRRALNRVRKASKPILEAKGDDIRGYKAGTYISGYCWITGNPDRRHRRRFTDASPGSDPFVLTEGQTFVQPLPQRAPHEAITGIALLLTTPGGNYPADAFIQTIIDIRRFIPPSRRMRGPLMRKMKPPTTNETYVGWESRYPTVRRKYRRSPHKQDYTVHNLLIGWQFLTDAGWSAIQSIHSHQDHRFRKNTALWCRPRRVSRLATHWRIVVKMKGGNWQTSNYRGQGADDGRLRLKTWFPIIASNPDKWFKRNSLMGVSDIYEDFTGVETPEEPLEAPELTATPARISAGTYDGFITDVYDDGESRPSDRSRITITSGQNILVRFRDPLERRHGSVLPNLDTNERRPNDDPVYWTRLIPARISPGNTADWEIKQPAGPTTTQVYASLDGEFPIVNGLPYSFRFYASVTRRVNGAVGYRLQFKTAAGAITETHNITTTTTGVTEATIGPAGSGADYTYGAAVTKFDFVVVGTPTASAVNIDADIYATGMFVGYGAPRLRVHDGSVRRSTTLDEGSVPKAEDYVLQYPEAPYGVVVEDYDGDGVSAWEFYAPYDTLLNKEALPQDFEVTVRPNTQYTLQTKVELAGVPTSGVELFGGVYLDADGDQLDEDDNPPPITIAPNTRGFESGIREVTFTTPPEARVWKCTYHTTGRGRYVVYKPQLEKGATKTSWTAAHKTSGKVDQIFTTWCPGVNLTSKGGMLSFVREFLEIIARADDPDGTTVTGRVRFKRKLNDPAVLWGPWYTDPAAISWLAVERYAHVEITLTTADVLISPELFEYGLRVDREGPVFLRKDGSEFVGGIAVTSMPALNYPVNEEERRNRMGEPNFLELFSWKDNEQMEGLELTAYSRDGVQQAHREAARGDRLFELNYRGLEMRLRILDLKFEPNLAEQRDGFGEWIAKGVKAQVLSVRDIA